MDRDRDPRSWMMRLTPLRAAAVFVLIGFAWIFFSDLTPQLLGLQIEQERLFQTLKGWGFVLVMGVIFYLLTKRLAHITRARETELQGLLDNLPALISRLDSEGRIRLGNSRFQDWFGHRSSSFIGKSPEEILGADSDEKLKAHIKAALAGERVSYEFEIETMRGRRTVNLECAPDRDEHGAIRGSFMLITDLSGQRAAETALRETEQRYQRLVEGAPVGILINQDNRFVYANMAAAEILGASTPDDLIGRPALSHIDPEFVPIVKERIQAVLERGESVPRLEERFLRLDGSPVEVEVAASGCIHEGRSAIQVIIRDVSDRVAAERARRQSEEQYRRIIETTHEGVWVVDESWRTTFVNNRMAEMLGYEPEELHGRDARELVAPEHDDELTELIRRRERGVAEDVDIRLVRRDGGIIWVHMIASPFMDENSEFQGALAMVSDITERKNAEDRLRESEGRFVAFMNNSPAGAWLKDEGGRYVYLNKTILNEYRLTPEEVIGRTDADLFPPEVAAELKSNDDLALSSDRTIETQETIPNPDGQDHIWQILKFPVRDIDGRRLVGGFALDITDQMHASREKQRLLAELHERVKEMQALNRVLDLLQDPSVVTSQALSSVAAVMKGALRSPDRVEVRVVFAGEEHGTGGFTVSGHMLAAEFTTIHGESGRIEVVYPDGPDPDAGDDEFLPEERNLLNAVASLLRSFLERVRASKALAHREALYRHVVEAQTELLCRWKPDTTLTFVNDAYQRMFAGDSGAELTGRKWIDFVSEETRDFKQSMIETALQAGPNVGVNTYENLIIDHAGRRRWMQWRDRPVFDDSGRLVEVQSAGRDITERVEAENALKLSEERFHVVASATTDVIWDWDLVHDHIWWSEGMTQLFGHTLEEQSSKIDWWANLVHPEDRSRVSASLNRIRRSDDDVHWSEEYRLRRADGSYAIVHDRGDILRDSQGKPIRMVGGITDITEKKAAERRQKLMMQELDHRVKNNLATVLSIAESTFRVSDSLDQFAESFTGRIRALARMHALLAYSRWEGISLRQLMERTLEAYAMNQDSTVTIEGEDIELSPTAAPVLCMAVHELATNAAKYGSLSVPGGRVAAHWRIEEVNVDNQGPVPTFFLEWRESDGPAVEAPSRRGLGSDLIEGAVNYELNGTVEMRFHTEGLACTLQAPLDSIIPEHESGKPAAHTM